MQQLINQITSIDKKVMQEIEKRLAEFSSFKDKNNEDWFSELCFCILTANSKATTGIAIQGELGFNGFTKNSQEEISSSIRKNKHRFHNNKSKYIVAARKYLNIKEILKGKSEIEAREWLVNNVKGLGYKEASHFLRNTGSENIAILDRHILSLMKEHNIIEKPKTLTKKSYLEIEEKFNKLASEIKMTPAKLDLCMWYLKTGRVLK